MIKSMTGFASESFIINSTKFLVEIKSINSKILDLNIRIPQFLKLKENEIRKKLSSRLNRGKIELNVNIESKIDAEEVSINKEVVNNYMKQLKDICENSQESDHLKIAMKLPNAYTNKSIELNNSEINNLSKNIFLILEKLIDYRLKEGKEMGKDIQEKISNIKKSLMKIEKIETKRVSNKKNKLIKEIEKIEIEIDNNRLEQEMIYYLEKFDINEEIIRLKSHIIIFEECLKSNSPIGKKLGFICQEIGREINTIGSKANDANLQKNVIEMKDNLEKIKENILNIL